MPPPERARTPRRAIALGLMAGVAAAAAAALLKRLDAVEVSGGSMAPALLPGDRLLVESWTYARRAPRSGEVVLGGDPRDPSRELVKRVAAVRDGRVELHGDAPAESTDSRHFGWLPTARVRWRATLRYWPPSRVGPIARAPLAIEGLGGEPACSAFGELVAGVEEEPA